MKVAVLGCATGLYRSLRAAGIEVIALARDEQETRQFEKAGVATVPAMVDYFEVIEHPRSYVLDIELGQAVDNCIDSTYVHMEPGDIVLDPSGSYWCDTMRRYRRMRHRSIFYIDIAWIERHGRSRLLVSGDDRAVERAGPILERWAGDGGFVHVGGAGLAHFILMIEEAAANAEVQARSEAAQMLEAWPSVSDETAVKDLFPLMERRWTGRAAWQLDDAVHLEAATPLLAQAMMLNLTEALDDHASAPPAPRVGGFQHPEEIL
ncbi:MAG: hypothetical protein KDG54_01530 [Geminicoccaceae bacterium]|nr:hypothetical protein [Geminicoccaceae bacterium]